VNQSLLFPVQVEIPDPSPTTIVGTITFSSAEFGDTSVQFSTTVAIPEARIAFDTAHTPWAIDSHYGQFRELYTLLTDNGISVTEIRNSSLITLSYLETFDMVAILDPCVWGLNETDPMNLLEISFPFTSAETQAYEDYYNGGGGIFVATLSNATTDIPSLNDFLSWTGFSMTGQRVPSSGDTPISVTQIAAHTITSGVSSFHYLGGTINVPFDGDQLALVMGHTVLASKEDTGRFVITGTNYFIDNYALTGNYGPADDSTLALRIFMWAAGLIS
jgi:hypothetical protein